MKCEKTEVWGFEHAIRGMRNPLNSWSKSDSNFDTFNCTLPEDERNISCDCCRLYNDIDKPCIPYIGDNDLNLMQKLINGGSEHRKYLRQIFISVDITAPLYWWKEFDTYKVGTVANSCSTMHTIHKKEFELDDFSHDKLYDSTIEKVLLTTIHYLNTARYQYLKTGDKEWWWQMIQLLPSSYNQKRTITMNYENIRSIYAQRHNHKLDEWRITFCEWIKSLPYANELILYNN